MGRKMQVGVRVPPCQPAREIGDFACEVEQAGFDALYVPDSQTLWRDAYLTLYASAVRTSRIRLVTAVSNVITRHPTVIAGLARSIDEAAPGRFVLGLGVGHSSVEPIGVAPSTGAQLRDGVDQIRRLVRGEQLTYGEGRARIRDPRPDGIPVHIAATGPRNLRLAGAIGDGAILLSGVAADPLRHAVGLIRQGAIEAGRDPDDLQITVAAHTMVTDDIERDARILKPVVATIAQKGGRGALELLGIKVDVPAHVPEVTPDLIHAEDWDLAVEVSSRWISDADAAAFARGFCLFGSAADIVERLHVIADLGITSVFMQHVGSWDLPERLVHSVGREVLPLLGDAAHE
ncbi:LLM class flavin-dependent oxidoreductase [Micromonospora sp. NBC_00617]|uniref:LLM class flavin-dependent oxidoreductase n=1 Tax=Micromonospora sp. NBC_00617 TaxID=2903587 RepID=UPI0030DDF9DA